MQPELTESIEKTDIFLIVLSEYYHEDPECIEQVLYAKNLGNLC